MVERWGGALGHECSDLIADALPRPLSLNLKEVVERLEHLPSLQALPGPERCAPASAGDSLVALPGRDAFDIDDCRPLSLEKRGVKVRYTGCRYSLVQQGSEIVLRVKDF